MTRWTRIAGLAALALIIVMSGAIFGPGSIHVQGNDNDYVDVGLILEVPDTISVTHFHDLNIIVVNQGSRTAYDVEVVVTVTYPVDSSGFREAPEVPVGSASLDIDTYTLRWSIPELGGLQREEVTAEVRHIRTIGGPPFDNDVHPHKIVGTVTTTSFESDLHRENNETQVWSYSYSDLHSSRIQAEGNYLVTVSVDNPVPAPGGAVNFTITADRENPIILSDGVPAPLTAPPIDLEVDVELTDGLTVSGTPSYGHPGTTKPGSVSYSNGVFNIGTLKRGDGEGPKYSVTLPVTVANNAVVNEQCLTATLTGNPPPGTGRYDDDISDNVAKVCLGDQPVEPFVSGQVDAFTIYPCVGDADPPCDSTDDVRVRAVNNSSGQVLASGTAVFQIDPTNARIYDDHENSSNVLQSVNDGNTVSWQTSVTAGKTYTGGLSGGIELYYSRAPYVGKTSGWGGLTMGIAARDVDGGTPPPGKVFLRSTTTGNTFRKAESTAFEHVPTAPTTTSTPTSKINYFLEFEKLGTYLTRTRFGDLEG